MVQKVWGCCGDWQSAPSGSAPLGRFPRAATRRRCRRADARPEKRLCCRALGLQSLRPWNSVFASRATRGSHTLLVSSSVTVLLLRDSAE